MGRHTIVENIRIGPYIYIKFARLQAFTHLASLIYKTDEHHDGRVYSSPDILMRQINTPLSIFICFVHPKSEACRHAHIGSNWSWIMQTWELYI